MTEENQYLLAIKKELFSGNETTVLQCLADIRINGNQAIIEPLLDLYILSSNKVIKNNILKILSDLKDKNSTPTILTAINNIKYKTIKKDIISTCWQNGLDYSEHILFFTEIVIKDELEIAIEAFTVLDETIPNVSDEKKDEILNMLKLSLNNLSQDKKDLIGIIIEKLK